MGEIARLLVMIGMAAVGLTLVGGAVIWFMEPGRRIRQGLKKVLGEDPHALLVAAACGKGVGFDFTTHRLAVTWDAGGWCLIYSVEELVGAELIVDGRVVARVHRGESRKPLETFSGAEAMVRLRLVFSDPAHPDFDLDLWTASIAGRRGALTADEAAQEANRWLARTEALLRRPLLRRTAPEVTAGPIYPSEPPTARQPLEAEGGDEDSLTV